MSNANKVKVLKHRKTIFSGAFGSAVFKFINKDAKSDRAKSSTIEYTLIVTPRTEIRERGAKRTKHTATVSRGKVQWRRENTKKTQ
jgi:hypothetical protein